MFMEIVNSRIADCGLRIADCGLRSWFKELGGLAVETRNCQPHGGCQQLQAGVHQPVTNGTAMPG